MRKALYIVGGISFAGIFLFSMSEMGNANNFFSIMGLCAWFAAAIDIAAGVLLLLLSIAIVEVRPYAAACLLIGGIMLLCGFTLCSNTHANMGHM